MGRAHGHVFGLHPAKADGVSPMESVDEIQLLRADAEYMQKMLAAINRRIESLEKESVDTVD